MGRNYLWILIVFLVACAQTPLNTVPTANFSFSNESADSQETVNPCATILCSSDKVCVEGTCVCPQKTCNGKCVSADTCCSNSDCPQGQGCSDGTCVEKPLCKLGEDFIEGECQCDENHFYCGAQMRCIPRGKCCEHNECQRFERCVPWMAKSRLCVQEGEKKTCKLFTENGRDELFFLNTSILRVNDEDYLADRSVNFNVSGEILNLQTNVTFNHSNATFYQEGIETIGGYCKPDEPEEDDED